MFFIETLRYRKEYIDSLISDFINIGLHGETVETDQTDW